MNRRNFIIGASLPLICAAPGAPSNGAQIPWQTLLELAPIQSSVKKRIADLLQEREKAS